MSVNRRDFIRRLSILSGMGAAGGLPTQIAAALAAEPEVAPQLPVDALAVTLVAGAATRLWDGASGVTRQFFNYGARLPWQNIGGDWSDAQQAAQGTAPYATIAFPAAGPATASIATLVRRWYANANAGLFVKATANACYVATRANATAALRPQLTLRLSDGSVVDAPCRASTVANKTTEMPITGEALVLQSGSSLVLQFDLPALGSRTIADAILKLTATKVYGNTTANIFELRPPKFFAGGTPIAGLADKYDHDNGIAKDPRVYFATQFSETAWRQEWIGGLAADAAVVADPTLATPALSVKYHAGEFSPCSLDYMWSQKIPGARTTNLAGTLRTRELAPASQYNATNNADCPSEAYFRYYLKLAANFQCAVDGKKLPGLAGRYGYWNGTDTKGYYQAVAGNGGAPTRGTRVLNAGYPGGSYLSGWSMRNHAYVGPADANPYRANVVASTYAYHAAMTGWYGDMWRWGTPQAGYVNFEPDRWYCVEQYVKMNSVTAPFDSLGNGVGHPDGILRAWVDGVLVFEKLDVVYRKNLAIRIDEIWLDHYHGGTIPAEEEHGFEMANLVVAADYIGPMKGVATSGGSTSGATPAWLADKAVNEWIAIGGTALSTSSCAAQATAGLTNTACQDIGFGNPLKGILAYSGGTLKADGSEMLIFGGGGANAWAGNDVRGLRLEDDAPTWRTRVTPTARAAVPASTAASQPYMVDGATPIARHSFWQPQFIDSANALMVFGCADTWSRDSGQYYTVDSVSLDNGQWSTPGSHPTVPIGRGWDGNWVVRHPVTEDVYVSGASGVAKWSRATNTFSILWTDPRTDFDRATASIDPRGTGTLLRLGAYGTSNVPIAIDLATGTPTVGTLVGPYAAAIDVGSYYAAGLVFDAGLGKFVLFQDDGYLYTLTRTSPAQWSVERLALAGTPPDVEQSSGPGRPAIWGRMQYVPKLKGVCIVQSCDRPAYFVRTA